VTGTLQRNLAAASNLLGPRGLPSAHRLPGAITWLTGDRYGFARSQRHAKWPGRATLIQWRGHVADDLALLGLLAYKAYKSSGGLGNVLGGGQAAPGVNPGNPGGLGDILGGLFGGGAGGSSPGGNLGGLISGGLGGLLGGAGAGSVLSGGLGNLIKDLQNNGQGHVAQSWVANAPNQPIAPESLEAAACAGTLDALAKQTGMNRDGLLTGLSQQLPALVDHHLTPEGRVPTQEEAQRMV
jgi:uncharacterized protein YidB (DUF937 family)